MMLDVLIGLKFCFPSIEMLCGSVVLLINTLLNSNTLIMCVKFHYHFVLAAKGGKFESRGSHVA